MRKKLGEMLVEAGVIREASLRAALNEQRRWGGSLGRTLIEMKLIGEMELVNILSKQLNMPTVDLDKMEIRLSVIETIPAELALQHYIIPFDQEMTFLDVAMVDANHAVIDELRIKTQLDIRPALAGPKAIERAIAHYYGKGFGWFYRPDPVTPVETDDVIPAGKPAPRVNTLEQPSPISDSEGIRPHPRPSDQGLPLTTPRTSTKDVEALQLRIAALIARDEEALKKLLSLLVEKGATHEEILERLK